jgi:hypothetical protein
MGVDRFGESYGDSAFERCNVEANGQPRGRGMRTGIDN